ncbi:MAG: hypothetical protein ACXVPU_08270 [Bacteroidia bacterium]
MNNSENLSTLKIPFGISEYIKKHFEGSFLSEIKEEADNAGQKIFKVDISHENSLYHLKFNSAGSIIEERSEPIWELSDEDEYNLEDQ